MIAVAVSTLTVCWTTTVPVEYDPSWAVWLTVTVPVSVIGTVRSNWLAPFALPLPQGEVNVSVIAGGLPFASPGVMPKWRITLVPDTDTPCCAAITTLGLPGAPLGCTGRDTGLWPPSLICPFADCTRGIAVNCQVRPHTFGPTSATVSENPPSACAVAILFVTVWPALSQPLTIHSTMVAPWDASVAPMLTSAWASPGTTVGPTVTVGTPYGMAAGERPTSEFPAAFTARTAM